MCVFFWCTRCQTFSHIKYILLYNSYHPVKDRIDKEYLSSKNLNLNHNDISFSGKEVSLSDELISVSGNPISFAKKDIFKGLSDEIKIDLKRKLLYLSGTSSIFIDGKNISGEDIVFDYKNNSILNSENLGIKSENS